MKNSKTKTTIKKLLGDVKVSPAMLEQMCMAYEDYMTARDSVINDGMVLERGIANPALSSRERSYARFFSLLKLAQKNNKPTNDADPMEQLLKG